ncbi:MAG: sulfite exporter TauE/SafE family protein [Gammaproteobacteria bacterium]|jgi:uncharacterized membrane protein YfcA|nr:sulfite exporter TauE/SafE family protein [Gammaproteobacteria bacterium]
MTADLVAQWLPSIALLSCAGLAAGLVAGLLGVGGGIVMVPALEFAFAALGVPDELRMHLAVGTSLTLIVPTALASSRAHRAAGAVDEHVGALWAPAMAGGAVAGAALAGAVSGAVLSAVFACVALLAAAKMLLPLEQLRLNDKVPQGAAGRVVPGAIGLVSAMMGIGGGTLSVPVLHLYGVPVHRAVGTSAWLGLWVAVPAAAGFAMLGFGVPGRPPGSLGYVSLVAVALLWPAGWLAAPWGARLAHRLPRRYLSVAFGAFLLLVALRMGSRSLS